MQILSRIPITGSRTLVTYTHAIYYRHPHKHKRIQFARMDDYTDNLSETLEN